MKGSGATRYFFSLSIASQMYDVDGTASTGDVEKERHQKMAEVLPPYAAHNTEI